MRNEENLELSSAILCQNISIDSESNNVSIFNVLEQLNLPEDFFKKENKTRVIPIMAILVTFWKNRSQDKNFETEAKIIFTNPKKENIGEFPFTIKFKEQSASLRHSMKMQGLKIVGDPGEYRFRVLAKQKPQGNFEEMGSFPIDIKSMKN